MGVNKLIHLPTIFKSTLGINGKFGKCGSSITREHIALGAHALEQAFDIVPDSDKKMFDIQKNDEKYTMRGQVKSVKPKLKNPTQAPYDRITLFYLFVESHRV
jgi:hypothetical protein